MMNPLLRAALVAGTCLLTLPAPAAEAKLDLGRREYLDNCAICHGQSGRGDGPMSMLLTKQVPDITLLQRTNNGVYPFDYVYDTIDGRERVQGHGTREMPIWGRAYGGRADQAMPPFWPYDREAFIRARILALTEHIYTLQRD
jgi:mono/diheme cytochrome c family protein